jgi:hypothetical protein
MLAEAPAQFRQAGKIDLFKMKKTARRCIGIARNAQDRLASGGYGFQFHAVFILRPECGRRADRRHTSL